MELSFIGFITELFTNPALFFVTVLVLGVLFVNGLIDAPNAIATCVSTRSITPKKAIIMSAVCSFLGLLIMTMISSTVAKTVYHLVDFGNDKVVGLVSVCAALSATIVWSILSAKLSIPSSQSHALIAGLSGASISIYKGFDGINYDEWKKVICGLIISVFIGFIVGYIVTKIIEKICKNMDRRKTLPFFKGTSVFGGASMAFLNGAQDGQKYIGVLLLGMFMSQGLYGEALPVVPVWLMFVCSFTMTLGIAIGGMKIIKTLGSKLVKLEPYQGTAADIAASICLLFSSLTGIPISSTHTKTTAMMGVGASRHITKVNWNVVKNMILAWFVTFPGCGLLGFLFTKLFLLFV